jgi:hypothetical protein
VETSYSAAVYLLHCFDGVKRDSWLYGCCSWGRHCKFHLALNGAIGYSYTSPLLVQEIWTESQVAGGVSGIRPPWTNITGPECQQFFQQLSININVESVILVVNDTTSTNILNYLPNTSEAIPNISFIEYCFTYPPTPQCSITLQWAPRLIVTFALLIKTGVILVCLRFVSHFQQRLFCCIADLLDFAIQHTPDIVIPHGECQLDNRKTRSGSQYEKTLSGVRRTRSPSEDRLVAADRYVGMDCLLFPFRQCWFCRNCLLRLDHVFICILFHKKPIHSLY